MGSSGRLYQAPTWRRSVSALPRFWGVAFEDWLLTVYWVMMNLVP